MAPPCRKAQSTPSPIWRCSHRPPPGSAKRAKSRCSISKSSPNTRVPWRAQVDGDNIVFQCDTPLPGSAANLLQGIAQGTGATFTHDANGVSRLTVPKAAAERAFAAFSEENVQKLTHPEEYVARKSGGAPLTVAKDYTPHQTR